MNSKQCICIMRNLTERMWHRDTNLRGRTSEATSHRQHTAVEWRLWCCSDLLIQCVCVCMLGAAGNVAGPRWLLLFLALNRPLVVWNSAISAKYPFPRDKTIKILHYECEMHFSLKNKWQQSAMHICVCQTYAELSEEVNFDGCFYFCRWVLSNFP